MTSRADGEARGALAGIRIVEMASIGPVPFTGMMLADQGAEVIRIERPGGLFFHEDSANRSRRSLMVDVKQPDGIAIVRDLCRSADGVIEGYRPGVMERLGLGPDRLLADNPALVYGRVTGWGQDGPLSQAAGHDLNYIAVSGVLHMIGEAGRKPVPPSNLVGDFGGGAMFLAFGMVAALLAVRSGGAGQVIDVAMTEGSALLASMVYSQLEAGLYHDAAGVNILDGGAHFYNVYTCADGRWITVAAIEPPFYRLLLEKLGLADDPAFTAQHDQTAWPALKEKMAAVFVTRTRDEWCALLEGTDACFAPVLSMREAQAHPHNRARGAFIALDGAIQPGITPRLSAGAPPPRPTGPIGGDGEKVLLELGYSPERIGELRAGGALLCDPQPGSWPRS